VNDGDPPNDEPSPGFGFIPPGWSAPPPRSWGNPPGPGEPAPGEPAPGSGAPPFGETGPPGQGQSASGRGEPGFGQGPPFGQGGPPAGPWGPPPPPGSWYGGWQGGYGPWGPWYPAPPPPPRRSPNWIAGSLAIVLVAGVVGVGAGLLYSRLGSPSGSSSAIGSQVDPAVVDIDTTLAGGTGEEEGTGMVISSSGLVLTNNHVIAGSDALTVQVDGSGLTTVSFGDSDKLGVGDPIFIVGNALGLGGTPAISSGSVAALDQTITASDPTGARETLNGMIQVNAVIQSGDSGGPLVNSSGQVVGMDTAGAGSGSTPGPTTSQVGFAIPINTARSIAAQIQARENTGDIEIGPGPLIGVVVQDSTSPAGAQVVEVEANTPAASAGVVEGDVIVSLGGKTIGSSGDLSDALRSYRAGQSVSLGWDTAGGSHMTATITLASGPPA